MRLRPYSVPMAMTVRSSSPQTSGRSVRLMKPGPATSTFTTVSSAESAAAMASASSRGFLPASLASTIAALVAMSPCEGSFGGSTMTRARSAPGASGAAIARTRASMSAKRCCGGFWDAAGLDIVRSG